MGYAQWILVQDSARNFRFVSDRGYKSFHAGSAPLPQVSPREVRVVDVLVHLEARIAARVHTLNHRRFAVLDDGVRDPAEMEWEMALCGMIPFTGSARRRLIERHIAGAFRWVPSADDARAIADAVNRRARWPLLGRTALRLLGP